MPRERVQDLAMRIPNIDNDKIRELVNYHLERILTSKFAELNSAHRMNSYPDLKKAFRDAEIQVSEETGVDVSHLWVPQYM